MIFIAMFLLSFPILMMILFSILKIRDMNKSTRHKENVGNALVRSVESIIPMDTTEQTSASSHTSPLNAGFDDEELTAVLTAAVTRWIMENK